METYVIRTFFYWLVQCLPNSLLIYWKHTYGWATQTHTGGQYENSLGLAGETVLHVLSIPKCTTKDLNAAYKGF